MAKQETSFEKDLESLEQIVHALEEGGLPLDVSLRRFEEGVKLVRRCEKALGAAEKRIELLTKNADGELETKPFGDAEEEGSPAAQQDRPDEDDVIPDPEEEEDEDELLF
jgi:exodeoxyribonuclease VII small subunit